MSRSSGPRIAVCFHHLAPYHHARLRAAGERARLVAFEVCSVDQTHGQKRSPDSAGFDKVTLIDDAEICANGRPAVSKRMAEALTQFDPAVVAIPGWSHPAALAALLWCLRRQRPAVLMSESTAFDQRRRWWREALKRRIVAAASAALAGGAPQGAYLRALGLRGDAVFLGYDAVDNDYFAEQSARVRKLADPARARLKVPERYFLASGRFVPKKNLTRLVDAYALYRRRIGAQAWHLVLLGDGELRAELQRRIARADLASDVSLPGFAQYEELPTYYGLAGAFVHASTTEQWGLVVNEAMASGLPVLVSDRCGCAPDLVREGVNGFTFDPYDPGQLAGLMLKVSSDQGDREAMGRASREIIKDWGPERFADGLMEAVEVARSRPLPKASWLDRSLLWALVHR